MDDLKQLLEQADRSGGPPLMPSDLAERVRRRGRRRRVTRLVASGAGTVVLALAAMWTLYHLPRPALPIRPIVRLPAPPSPLRDDAELRRLDAEAQVHQQLADALWQAERRAQRLARANAILAAPDAFQVIQSHRDQAALTTLEQADRLLHQLKLTDEAKHEYEQAIRLFPETPGAAVARQRLQAMNSEKEG